MIIATFVVLTAAAIGFAARLWRGPSLGDRIIAVNGLLVVGMGAIAAHAAETGTGAFLPALIAIALVGPIGTAMIARYIEGKGE